jgi:hypothetical protein
MKFEQLFNDGPVRTAEAAADQRVMDRHSSSSLRSDLL